jgi:tricorn protease
MLLRQPTHSKQHIVFVHDNDFWVVAREGGDVQRFTTAIGAETSPKLTADSEWLLLPARY